MQRWEYLSLSVFAASPGTGMGIQWRESTGRAGHTTTEDEFIKSVVNQLGLERWELAGVAGSDRETNYRMFFKRPNPA